MMEDRQIISTESYELGVTVKYENEDYVGKLIISPEIKKLIISADLTEERKFKLPSYIENLFCDDFKSRFILSNLVNTHYEWAHINKSLMHCKAEYEFDSLFQYDDFEEPKISRVNIQSYQLNSWILYTTKQQNLMLDNNHPQYEDLFEFSARIDGIGTFGLFYDYQSNSSHERYFKGVSFLPTLRLTFDSPCDHTEALSYIKNTIILMGFLIGGDFKVDKASSFSTLNSKGYFYVDGLNLPIVNHAFFPQSINQHPLNGLDIPPLNNYVFSNYFKFISEGEDIWKRYIRYKKMSSIEEKFLGFFRLLEKLTYKKDFYMNEDTLVKYLNEIKGKVKKDLSINSRICKNLFNAVKYGNRKKLNTETCIQLFIKNIDGFDDIGCKYSKKDIGGLVKLRNDITHANTITLNNDELECLTKFTEMLLIFALLLKLEVPSKDISKIIHRFEGMHLIYSE